MRDYRNNLLVLFPKEGKKGKKENHRYKICLRSAYFTETENFLLKILQIKVKVS